MQYHFIVEQFCKLFVSWHFIVEQFCKLFEAWPWFVSFYCRTILQIVCQFAFYCRTILQIVWNNDHDLSVFTVEQFCKLFEIICKIVLQFIKTDYNAFQEEWIPGQNWQLDVRSECQYGLQDGLMPFWWWQLMRRWPGDKLVSRRQISTEKLKISGTLKKDIFRMPEGQPFQRLSYMCAVKA